MKRVIKSGMGNNSEVYSLVVDMTNTGFIEDGILHLNLRGNTNEVGTYDSSEFVIYGYDENGDRIGSKKLDFEELFKKDSVNSSRKIVKSGVSQAIQMRKDYDAIDDAVRHFRVEYGKGNEELYQLTKELDEVLDKMFTIVHNYGKDEKQKEREAYDAAFQSFDKNFYNELIKKWLHKRGIKRNSFWLPW